MKIVVPMAGVGKRMRPHTLTVPKPLLPIAGKPIVQRLVEDIAGVCKEQVEEIAFVIGDFGNEVEEKLDKIASDLGAKASIHYQEEALGTAHAILCAEKALEGKVIVAFADTLFKADFTLDDEAEGIVWVKKIEEDPSSFGVVKLNENNTISEFVEKSETFVSDLAIIGIYYFKDGAFLKDELQYLVDNDIKDKGEYQLTNALENMKNKGLDFRVGKVEEWLDCGKKDVTVHTNQRVLEFDKDKDLVSGSAQQENSLIIPPCFVGDNVVIKNSIIGPHVSIGKGTKIERSVISNSIIQQETRITNANFDNSMVGNFVELSLSPSDLSIGDYATLKK